MVHLLLFSVVLGQTSAPAIRIDAGYPGGNIRVERIEGDRVVLRPDPRDTPVWWFYWNFRVRGAAGRTLIFAFEGPDTIGVRGPAVSTDAGGTWSWLGRAGVGKGAFIYRFADDADEVRFAFTIPYLESNLRSFLKRHQASGRLRQATLCTSKKGRAIESLHFGTLHTRPERRVLIVARQHACEAMASYVLEGLIDEVVSGEKAWLREQVEFLAVPFMDKDGVEDGDQGKSRAPRDHNRDYDGQSIHPSVRRLRDIVPEWSAGRLRVALDLHCPHIRGPRNEVVYFVGGPDERIWSNVQQFARILETLPPAGLPYRASDNLPFGKEWNSPARLGEGKTFARWASELRGVEVATTLEVPYANASGVEVNPESARSFGRSLAWALEVYLSGEARAPVASGPAR